MGDSEKIRRIKMMLESEEETISRRRKEITVDCEVVAAEHVATCLRKVIKVLEK